MEKDDDLKDALTMKMIIKLLAISIAAIGVFYSFSLYAESAPQQAVKWIQMCFWVIAPYCFARLIYM